MAQLVKGETVFWLLRCLFIDQISCQAFVTTEVYNKYVFQWIYIWLWNDKCYSVHEHFLEKLSFERRYVLVVWVVLKTPFYRIISNAFVLNTFIIILQELCGDLCPWGNVKWHCQNKCIQVRGTLSRQFIMEYQVIYCFFLSNHFVT